MGSRIGFLFAGQGAQQVGMGRTLIDNHAACADLFRRAGEVLGYDLLEICLEGPGDKLDLTCFSQPALFVCGLAAVEALRLEQPDAVSSCVATAGLSLGEYTALVFAGVLDFETGLRLVQARGEAMQAAAEARPSGMVSLLGLQSDQVETLCRETRQDGEILQIANYLCPGNIVVSGDRQACDRIAAAAPAAGAIKAVPLAVAGAFHTPIMSPAVQQLEGPLDEAEFAAPRLPVVSNVDGRCHDDPEEIRQLLKQQIVAPVRWEHSMRYLLDEGCEVFYELGPGRVLSGLLKRIHRKTPCQPVPC